MGKKSRAKKERKAFEAIAASMPDLDDAGAFVYDDSGWPAGREGEQAARFLMEEWLNRLDADGWDQPDSVMLVTKPEATAADLAAEGIDVGELGDLLIEQQGKDPSEVFAGALMKTSTLQVESHPVEAFWGQSAEAEVSAVGVAVEAWVSENTTVRPSQDPRRSEMRVLQLLTRSGQFFQMSRERGSDEITWGPGSQGRIGIVLHQFLGVPVPASWPRTSMARYCGYVAAEQCASVQQMIVRNLGPDGVTARGVSCFVLGIAMKQLWAMSRDGELLPLQDRALLREGLEDMAAWLEDENAREVLVEVTRRGFASRDWRDYVSSPQIREVADEDTLIPFHAPHDWASEDTIAAFVGTAFRDLPGDPLADVPKPGRKAAQQMLSRLGLT